MDAKRLRATHPRGSTAKSICKSNQLVFHHLHALRDLCRAKIIGIKKVSSLATICYSLSLWLFLVDLWSSNIQNVINWVSASHSDIQVSTYFFTFINKHPTGGKMYMNKHSIQPAPAKYTKRRGCECGRDFVDALVAEPLRNWEA